jgi:predicted O-methyltransferase YrrM
MDIKEILNKRPALHRTAEGTRAEMGIHAQVLDFLLEHVPEGGVTLETGCGLSTILFAHRSRHHIAITPNPTEIADLLAFCRVNGVRTDGLEMIEGTSEYVLPSLKGDSLDVILIDGRHGFPAPFMDWFYTAGRLKIGDSSLLTTHGCGRRGFCTTSWLSNPNGN